LLPIQEKKRRNTTEQHDFPSQQWWHMEPHVTGGGGGGVWDPHAATVPALPEFSSRVPRFPAISPD